MIIGVDSEATWHSLRSKHVGASESAALFGAQPDYALSHYALWQTKAGRIPRPEVDSKRIQAGKRLEGGIAEWIAAENGWEIEQFKGYAVADTCAGMGCTPDFTIEGDAEGLLEVKSVDWLQHKRAWGDEPPLHIQIQLQHQLHCTGLSWGVVGALIGGNEPKVYRYDYRPKIGAEIEKRVAAFWESVKAGKEPPVDGTDATAAALAAMFPEAKPGESIDMDGDNEFPERWAALVQAKADRKAAEATETASKNWLMAKIGTAELIRYGGAIVATAKTQTRKAYEVKESSSRVLRIKD